MIWGALSILIGIIGVFDTEKVRKNPELLRSGAKVAFTRSPVLLYYRKGQTQEELGLLLAENKHIRKKYIIERYTWCVVLFITGITLIVLNWQ